MKLVVDANILFAAAIQQGMTAKLLGNVNISSYTPSFILEEFAIHREEILLKTRRSLPEFRIAFSALIDLVRILESHEIPLACKEQAASISPDPYDIPYLALAIHLNCPLWSNDNALKRQQRVRIITTAELVKLLDGESL